MKVLIGIAVALVAAAGITASALAMPTDFTGW
jgi:hypothetical protein